ncbi:Ras-like GTP-binding protein Rho1 domain protein [Clavispora lusitaniae]|uniref:Ras-like GTP-binding protein Rho1 domain protein n=1 Tax=Clavispora lusitaniae TaxID=36911 RepID=UPI00202C0F68|nr:Ras-like GTP-binding protein Rho1 domain protein [Clavispora lusitaniae]
MSKRHSLYSEMHRSPDLSQGYVNPYEQRQSPQANARTIINDNPQVPDFTMLQQVSKKSAYSMKIVVVGDGGCGKTCLLVSYAQQKFPEVYVPTIFENYVTSVQSPTGQIVELALWDTAGQEEYDRLRPLSYPDSDVIIICFALDNLTSLQNIRDIWYPEVNHFCPGIPVLLVGTKSDLQSQIDPQEPLRLASEINAVGYVQCSAKTMFNVKTVFNFALNHYLQIRQREEQVEKSRKRLSRVMAPGHSRHGSHSRNGSRGHARTGSGMSFKKGHFAGGSLGSSVLLDSPLAEDNYQANPYSSPQPQKYNEEEFAFTRKKKAKKCTIL